MRLWLAKLKLLLLCGVLLMPASAALARATPQRKALVFEPAASDSIQSFYFDGQPVALFWGGDLSRITSLSIVEVHGRRYVRVWLYVLNKTDHRIELIPQAQVSLSTSAPANSRRWSS